MGCTVRDKHVRTNRRTRPSKPETDPYCLSEKTSVSKPVIESGLVNPLNDSSPPQNPSSSPNADYDESGWGYCTEEQLEEILMKNLEFLYNEAIARLVALGYDEDVALKAMLRNGHCYGGMDVLANILQNSLAYLNSGGGGSPDDSEPVFGDLRQLEGYSLAGMVRMLQQFRPQLSNGDAMWCLLMSDLHVGRASAMEIPVLLSSGNGSGVAGDGDNIRDGHHSIGGMSPSLCRFHSGWGFGNSGCCDSQNHGYYSSSSGDLPLQREIECPKRFNLSPSMKSLLKRNVALFAAGFRANVKQFHPQADCPVHSLNSGKSLVGSGADVPVGKVEDFLNSKNQDAVNAVLNKFRNLNLDENSKLVAEDQKDEVIVTLLNQIKELERHVKERKDWAHQKAMQAANKLSNDLRELKTLRMEREETQRLKKGKQTIEDSTMNRLSEMENALRKASSQVDRANAAVRRLETENAEIRAEMEASKLSAAESVTTCLEVARREKKCLKRLLAWEKQRVKLQDEIDDEREKISLLQQTLADVKQRQKDAESNWRQELNAKEQALAQVEEERHLKEAAEASSKRKLEALRLKIDIDFQRHKDDLLRLQRDLSLLKTSSQLTESHHLSNISPSRDITGAKPQVQTIAKFLWELDNLEDSSAKDTNSNRECIICLKDEVSVVFLPCAHQVMCASCGDAFGSKGKATCPCCHVPIEQKIRVYGASS